MANPVMPMRPQGSARWPGASSLFFGCVVSLSGGCASMPRPALGARPPVLRDVEGLAITSCLVAQKSPYVEAQGHAWGAAILERFPGEIDAVATIQEAVDAELALTEISRMHYGETRDGEPMLLFLCGELIDRPRVRVAIDRAVRELAPAYPRPPS